MPGYPPRARPQTVRISTSSSSVLRNTEGEFTDRGRERIVTGNGREVVIQETNCHDPEWGVTDVCLGFAVDSRTKDESEKASHIRQDNERKLDHHALLGRGVLRVSKAPT